MMNYGNNFGSYDTYDTNNTQSFGAGGFMNSTQDMTSSQVGSQGQQRKSRELQCVLPLTIKQLKAASKDSPDDAFRVDNKELSNVKVIGMVMELAFHSTYINFTLNDGTESIDVRLFLHGDDTDPNAENPDEQDPVANPYARLREGSYVCVIGSLRAFQDSINLSGYSARPIEDFNQVTHHFLECIHTHLINTRGKLNAPAAASYLSTPVKRPPGSAASLMTPTATQFSGISMSNADDDSNFTPQQQMVLNALGSSGFDDGASDTGIHLTQVVATLNGKMNQQEISNALTYLINEGHVYSTIDENHFKRTE